MTDQKTSSRITSWRAAGLALTLFGAGCVSTTLRVPAHHPARPDAPAARPAETATSLRSDAKAAPPKAEPAPAEMRHRHGGHAPMGDKDGG